MSALTLPLDNRESNKYIHALERQFKGKLRAARDVSVFFTTRGDTEDSRSNNLLPLFEQYKLLVEDSMPLPDLGDALDKQLTLGHYQIWEDTTNEHGVSVAEDVISIGGGLYLIGSGAEVTVSQNGSLTVPSEETFVVYNPATFYAWTLVDEGSVIYLLPHTGKAWYGAITPSAEDGSQTDKLLVVLLMADGTYHVKRTAQKISDNFEFFTHIYNLSIPTQSEVYFTGKEFDYRPPSLPAGSYVAPSFTYVPD